MGFQPGTNIVKVEKVDLVVDTHSILPRWRNHFFQLLNIELMMLGRQKKRTEEPLGSEPSAIEVEMAIKKLERHKSPGISQIPPELINVLTCRIW